MDLVSAINVIFPPPPHMAAARSAAQALSQFLPPPAQHPIPSLGPPHMSCKARAKAYGTAFDEAASANAKSKKPRYVWPSVRRGVSDAQASLQAAASVTRLLQTCHEDDRRETLRASEPASLPRFQSISISELPVMDGPSVAAPSAPLPGCVHSVSLGGAVLDGEAKPLVWPWTPSSAAASSSLKPSSTEVFISAFQSSRTVRQRHRLDDLIELSLDLASSDGKRGRTHVGVRAWFALCEDVMGVPADRPMDPAATPLWAKLEDEWLAMRFVCALVKDRGITPTSASQYFSSVQGWHSREHGVKLAGGLKLERLPQMLKGLRRIVGETPRPLRRGVCPVLLRQAMDQRLSRDNPAHANLRAALSVALQGLLRSAEYSSKSGKSDKFTLLRSDISDLSARQLILMMHPCKNMHHLGGKTCPLVLGAGGEYIDAVAEMHNLLRVDPAAAGSPLFRDPATNKPISYSVLNSLIKELMASVGEDPALYSTHSLRIGGASALFAQGASETVIRTMGRWSSDIHRLYVRACFAQCLEWTRKAGSAKHTAVAVEFDEVDDY